MIEKMSHLVIRESSDFSNTSFDSDLSGRERENKNLYQQMAASTDKVDKRIIDVYMLNKAK